MRRIALVVLALPFAACLSTSSDGAVAVRVSNESAVAIDRVLVGFPDGQEDYGSLAPGEHSDYRDVGRAYRYAYVEVHMGTDTLRVVPIDYVGESLLEPGRYTYELDLDPSRDQLTLTLRVDQDEASAAASLTWLSVTSWLLEAGDTRILLDGYLTRVDRRLVEADGSSHGPAVTDTAELRRLLAPALPDLRVDWILVGHAHWDHAFDVPALARLTGARIAGARTVCHQAVALGLPADRCVAVEGGETIRAGPHVRARVVRWHHSGDPATSAGRRLNAPLELRAPPPPDPTTGGLRPGFLEDYPSGGGARAFLVTVDAGLQRPLTLLWSNTGNPAAWDAVIEADIASLERGGVDLSNLEAAPAPEPTRDALARALEAEGLQAVDYWIGFAGSEHVRQVVGTLRPRTFIPQHWDDFWGPIDDGPGRAFSDADVRPVLDSAGVDLVVPEAYYQRIDLETR